MMDPGRSGQGTALTEADEIERLGIIGGGLLVAAITGVELVGRAKGIEFLAFVFLAGAAPPIAAMFLFFQGKPHSEAKLWLCARLFLGFMSIGVLGLGGLEYATKAILPDSRLFFAVVSGSAVAAAILYFSGLLDLGRRLALLATLDALLISLLVAVVVFFSPFDADGRTPVGRTPFLIDYFLSTPGFGWWWIFGLLFVGGMIWLCRFESRATIPAKSLIEALMLFGFGLFVLGLFDDELYLNLPHYLVHVGPAMHSYYGGIAMVDVFSIYGLLPWVVIEAAFSAIAPTFGTAALMVRLSMLAYLFSIGIILYAVSRWRLSAFGLMMAFVLVAITFHPGLYNLNALPSTTGLRYLVPALMVVVLTAVSSPVLVRWLAMALLALASLWSIETFVYTLAPWGYLLFLQAVRTRSIGAPACTLAFGCAAVLLAHAVFALGTYGATGEWVDYRPYLGLFGRFRPDQSSFWSDPIDPNFAAWVPVWMGLFLVLAAALYQALQGRQPAGGASRLVPVAAYGLASMSYFVGKPHWTSLGLAFLPVAVVLIDALQALALDPKRYGTIGTAVLFALVGTSTTLVAFGVERFARPALYDQANRTVLRRCFTADGCQLAEMPERLKQGIHALPLDPSGPVYQSLHDDHPINIPPYLRKDNQEGYQRIVELVSVLRDHAPNERRVNLLTDTYSTPYVSMTALMETGQWYSWPISSPLNDEVSSGVMELILTSVAQSRIRDGELLVVTDNDQMLKIEKRIREIVTARCHLKLIELRVYHSVLRMENCTPVEKAGRPQVRSSQD